MYPPHERSFTGELGRCVGMGHLSPWDSVRSGVGEGERGRNGGQMW